MSPNRCLRIVFFSLLLVGRWLCPCVVNSEWIQVPLIRNHEKQLDLGLHEQRIPSSIADKLEELAVSLRIDRNRTKQMDLELDLVTTTTTTTPNPPLKRRRVDTQVTKTRNTEPFSIFGFLRSFRDSFFFKSHASVKQKVGFLERIRNNILSEIKRRILGLFAVQRRQDPIRLAKREVDSHDRHDFVSADGALVTICFLTFSVFLIKLVLQIIYILKRKHYPMTSTGTEGTVGAVRRLIKKNQNARTMDPVGDEDDAKQYLNVMKSINVSAQ